MSGDLLDHVDVASFFMQLGNESTAGAMGANAFAFEFGEERSLSSSLHQPLALKCVSRPCLGTAIFRWVVYSLQESHKVSDVAELFCVSLMPSGEALRVTALKVISSLTSPRLL